jgi:HK97 family phage portal protein
MASTLHYLDGANTKNLTFPNYPDSAWEFITGDPIVTDNNKERELYGRVAAVYRVANMTADTIANIPFAVLDNRGEIVDQSEDWQNVVGFMDNPRELLRLWRLSLFMTGSAYGFMEGNRQVRNLRYIVPTSISPIIDAEYGLTGFHRTVGNATRHYTLKDNRIFWMFRQDHTTEVAPSQNTEMRALMAAAGVLYYSDYYVENFFQRGGIKPSLLFVQGSPTREDRERIEHVWDKISRGFYKYLGKVFNAETMTVQTIGDGIENMSKTELHDSKVADVAMAAGLPLSLLLANSANYATARIEKQTWLRDTITPWAEWFAEEMNKKLFKPLGYQFEFHFEAKTEMQEEERERAYAFQAYSAAGIPLSVAAQIVGVDLPAGMEYEQLDAMRVITQSGPIMVPSEDTDSSPSDPPNPGEQSKSVEPYTIDQLNELDLWRRLALRNMKRGKPVDFPFVCKSLDEERAGRIRSALAGCQTFDDIKAVFEVEGSEDEPGELQELINAINNAAELELKHA